MEGWKTKAAGLIAILSGLALLLQAVLNFFTSGSIDIESGKEGVALIIAGLGFFGVGHKIDKQKQAVVAQTGAIQEQNRLLSKIK